MSKFSDWRRENQKEAGDPLRTGPASSLCGDLSDLRRIPALAPLADPSPQCCIDPVSESGH
jgi:hypothetical protein